MQRTSSEPVLIKIVYEERELRERVRQAGGRWQPEERAWKVPYGVVSTLGLIDRIIGDI